MAVFKDTTITDSGRTVIADALANSRKIIFTKISTSNKIYADTVELTKLTEVEGIKQTVNISHLKQEGTKARLNAVFLNTGVTQSYKIETIALYGKLENGNEVLYSVTRAREADTMPAENGVNLSTVEIDLITEINNDNGARMEVNPSTLVTMSTTASETSLGITKYGTENNTALEGNRLAEIIGLEFGGNIQDTGVKTTGKFYYDTATKYYYECLVNNELTYNESTKFRAISNKPISDRLENLYTFKKETLILTSDKNTQGSFTFLGLGNVRILYVSNCGVKNEYVTTFLKTPDWFCENTQFMTFALVNGTGGQGLSTAECVFNPDKKAIYIHPNITTNNVTDHTFTGQCVTISII